MGDDGILADATDGELLNHLIQRLNDFCRQISDDDTARMTELLKSMHQLRDLLKTAARRMFPGDPEEYAEYKAMFAQPP
jgi:hypothetical protein